MADHGYSKKQEEMPSRLIEIPSLRTQPTEIPEVPMVDDSVQDHTLEKLLAEIASLKSEVNCLSAQLKGVKSFLNPDQLKFLEGSVGRITWSDKTKEESIRISYVCGHTGYEMLRSLGYPFPCLTSLRTAMKNVKVAPGILNDSFALLGMKAEKMYEQEKDAMLLLDEMAIQPKIESDETNKCLTGTITMPRPEDKHKEGLFITSIVINDL